MSFDLNPVAVTAAPLLRAIDAAAWSTRSELAEQAGRQRSNIARDIAIVVTAGLVAERDSSLDGKSLILTDDGRAQLAAIARAEAAATDPRGDWPEGIESLRHEQIKPDPDNARRDWTSEDAVADLQALADDIRQNGLLQNLVVRPNPDPLVAAEFILVGGERRWRAIGLLIQSGDWPDDRLITARRLTTDDVGIRLAALAENLQRRALNPIEEANAYRGLRDVGLTTEAIAERVAMTQRHVQARLQLLDLTEDQQRRMTLPADDPERLSVSEARRLVANMEAKAKARAKAEAELSPRARLIMAEMRSLGSATYMFEPVEVDGTAINDDPDAIDLDKAGLLDIPTTRRHDGRCYARLKNGAWDICTALFGETSVAAAKQAAERLRSELGLPSPAEGQVSTDWLNGPFEIPADVQAEIEAQKVAHAAQEAEWQARRDKDAAERQAKAERLSMTRVHADALLAKAAEPPSAPSIDGVSVIADQLQHALPWRVTSDGDVEDRDGNEVWYGGCGEEGVIVGMLVATSVNAAAGLATPPMRVITEDDDQDDA